MRKSILNVMLILILIGSHSCKKTNEETLAQVPSPDWKIDNTGKYLVSMTAVVRLTDKMMTNFSNDDKMGAFMKDECRGVGSIVKVGNSIVFFVMIHATATEQDKITFKYYNKKTSFMYATPQFLTFTIDGSFGKSDQPEILDLRPVK